MRGAAGARQLLQRYQARELRAVDEAAALRGRADRGADALLAAEATQAELRTELDVRRYLWSLLACMLCKRRYYDCCCTN